MLVIFNLGQGGCSIIQVTTSRGVRIHPISHVLQLKSPMDSTVFIQPYQKPEGLDKNRLAFEPKEILNSRNDEPISQIHMK